MFKKITTITAISTLVACSTSFEAEEKGPDFSETSASSTLQGDFPQLETKIDDQAGLALADVDVVALDRVEVEEPEMLIPSEVGPQERVDSFVVETAEDSYNLAALLSKRVDNELQLRLYPATNLSVKVCLNLAAGNECFKGDTHRFDNDEGGEVSVRIEDSEQARSFSLFIAEPGMEYAELGPFEMPKANNIWTEEQSCDSRARIEDLDFQVEASGQEGVAYVSYHSIDPTSALICGIDEAGDSACVWEPLSAGEKQLKVRVSDNNPEAFIRDERGCSIAIEPGK